MTIAELDHMHTDAPSASAPRVATLLSFPLTHPGGVSTYVEGLSRAVDRTGHARTCLIAPESFQGGPGDRVSQVRLAVRQFLALCRLGPEVVHTHEHPALLAAALLYQAISRRSVRVVHTVHVEPAHHWATWKRKLMGILLQRCSAVTAVSHHTAARLGQIADPVPTNVQVIYGAADAPPRPSTADVDAFRAAFGLDTAGPILCQISPLNFPRKVQGVCRLIEAFREVRSAFPRARLLIVGDGELRELVERARARLGLLDAVVLTGYLDNVAIPLALSDVYCHVTLQDACPLSLLEAMRAGKPVVAARSGGIPELVSNGSDALLVDPEPRHIAAALLDLLRDGARGADLGRHAAETAQRRFTWQRVAAEFAPLYQVDASKSPHIQPLQERVYGEDADYRRGSPHLTHLELQDRLLHALHTNLAQLRARDLPNTVLEIGAGHGGFTMPMLAWGYAVTATEMSRPSIKRLEEWLGDNPRFTARFDPDGSLGALGDQRFSAIVSVSVLHHIPDYVAVIRQAVAAHLAPGGVLVTLQDPTWYPRQIPFARAVDRVAYFAWRLFQGRYGEGLRTRLRRVRGVYDVALTADVVEYHVVRQGVDEEGLRNALAMDFEEVRLLTYWSTHSALWQWIGSRLGLVNTFGLIATGYRAPAASNGHAG